MTEKSELPTQGEPKPIDLKSADCVKSFMSSSSSEEEWNARCNQVQAANEGKYPSFWFPTIVTGGVARETSATWGGTDKIKVVPISPKSK